MDKIDSEKFQFMEETEEDEFFDAIVRKRNEEKQKKKPTPPPGYWDVTDDGIQDQDEKDWEEMTTKPSLITVTRKSQKIPTLTRGANDDQQSETKSLSIFGSSFSKLEPASTFTTVTESVVDTDASTITPSSCMDHGNPVSQDLDLPVFGHRETILELIEENPVVVLSGHTGCGKSSYVPQFILDHHVEHGQPVKILVTQPRKLSARSLAMRVCELRGLQLGGVIGYHVGLDKMNKSIDTKLLYVTTGVLKTMLVNKSSVDSFTHIILDEVHERDLDMDLILMIMKKMFLLGEANYLKLILMSATLNESSFQEYFSFVNHENMRTPNRAPYMNVGSGRAEDTNKKVNVFYIDRVYPVASVDHFILDNPRMMNCMLQACINQFKLFENIERENTRPGGVIIFLPGIQEIITVKNELLKIGSCKGVTLKILPLHSSIPWEEHKRIFEPIKPNQRKVILATNIAESSMTVPDVKYIIDFCLTKNMMIDQETKYPRLTLVWASKQQLIQRKGRVGRVSEGSLARLIPQEFYHQLPESHPPEMTRVPLTKVVLEAKLFTECPVKELMALAMNPPKLKDLRSAIIELKEIGALLTKFDGFENPDDGDLTALGRIISRLPIDVRLGKLVVFGLIFNVLEEAIIIASGLNGKSIFSHFFGREVDSYRSKFYWSNSTFSDCNAVLYAYQEWEKHDHSVRLTNNGKSTFCRNFHLEMKQLNELKLLKEEISSAMDFMHLKPLPNQPTLTSVEKDLLLKMAYFGAFYPNYFIKSHNPCMEKDADRVLNKKDPRNCVYLTGFPQERAKYGKLYINQIKDIFREVTAVEKIPSVTFDGSRVIVEFDRAMTSGSSRLNDLRRTGIGFYVHIAMKLRAKKKKSSSREDRDFMKVNIFSVEASERLMAKMKRSLRNGFLWTSVERLPPPKMSLQTINLTIKHVDNPNQFWIQYDHLNEEEEKMLRIIKFNIDKCKPVKRDSIKLKQFYLAPLKESDGNVGFYRGFVKKIEYDRVFLHYVDCGIEDFVPIKQLREITESIYPDLASIPALAIECSMASLQPNQIKNTVGNWSEEAKSEFKNVLNSAVENECAFNGTIYSCVASNGGYNRYIINLRKLQFFDEMGEAIDVSKWLLSKKFAEKKEESFLSKEDANNRQTFMKASKAMQDHLDRPNRFWEDEEDITMSNNSTELEDQRAEEVCELKGPFSPIETKAHYINDQNFKTVFIERESVNSILLDENPSDPQDVWLVSAQVNVSGVDRQLKLSHTSLMPSRIGLGATAAMMFAPRVQMRLSQCQTYYSGCRIGLGPKTDDIIEDGRALTSIAPQNDAEIGFDFTCTTDDISLVNNVRYYLSRVLKMKENVFVLSMAKSFEDAQRKIKNSMMELLFKEREFKPKDFLHPSNKVWMNFRENQRMECRNSTYDQSDWIYPLIEAPKTKESFFELEKLQELADQENERPFREPLQCPICPRVTDGLRTPKDIAKHITSQEHIKIELRVINYSHT